MNWFILIAGLFTGALIAYLVTRIRMEKRRPLTRGEKEILEKRMRDLEVENNVFSQNREMIRGELDKTRRELEDERRKNSELNIKLATAENELKNLLEKLDQQKKDIIDRQEKMSIQFRNLANEILEEKTQKFTDQNKTNLNEILQPLKERIAEFEKKVESSNKEHLERNIGLKEQISSLKELNLKITKEAENLTRALKGETKTQGNWGEFILESILEKSGLVKGREYLIQESFLTEEGKRYQPDVVIKLPEEKNIIIDSKVSLNAYERFVNAEDENERILHLRNHILSVRNHIKSLSEKNYQALGLKGLDFVLLFMPIEPAFSLALQEDDQLFLHAYEKNIVMVSPSTLIATLRTIASIWRQEYQNRNALEIAKQGGDLYDKFVNFTNDLIQLGDRLLLTQKSYEEAMKKLSSGTGNLVTRTEKLKKLGARVKGSMDPRLLDRAGENE